MKKSITIFSLLLLLISTMLPNGLIEKAEAAEAELEPGNYTIPVKFLKDDADEQSTMQKYVVDENVDVKITEDSHLVSLKLSGAEMIKEFGVNDEDLQAVSESGDTRTYEFNVDNFDDLLSGFVSVEVENIYSDTHDVRIQFDASEIPEKVIEEEPEGEETLIYFWDEEENQASSMQRYVKGDALITVENGIAYATVTLSASNLITDFGVNGRSAEIVSEDNEAKTRTYKFPVTDIDGLTEGFVEVDLRPMGMDIKNHDVGIYFNEVPVTTPEGDPMSIHFWDEEENQASSMQRYVKGDALITVENGIAYATVTLSASNLITDFGVNGRSAEIVSEDNEAKTRTYKFPVTDIDGLTEGFVEVDLRPMGMDIKNHDVGIYFGNAPVTEEEETEKPKDPKPENPKPENPKPEKENGFIYEDGTYDLPTTFLQENGKKSEMDDFVERNKKELKPYVSIKDGIATVFVTLNGQDMIKTLKIADNKAKRKIVSNDNNTATFSFVVDDLDKLIPGWVDIVSEIYSKDHDFYVSFDTSKLKLKKGEVRPTPTPNPIEKSKKTPNSNVKKKSKVAVTSTKDYAEGTYNIPVFIFKETGSLTKDNLSMMHTDYLVEDQSTVYFEKGKDPLVTIVLDKANLIQSFTVEGKKAKRVNLAGGQASFTFSVKNLDEIANGHIVIDTGFAIMPHDIRIGFDTSGIPGAGGDGALVSFLSDGGSLSAASSNNDDNGLTFDRFADGEQVAAQNASNQSKNINPKTDDMNYAKISLFALLFLMSTTLLGVFIRKKFVKSV